jgi:syntaxin 6
MSAPSAVSPPKKGKQGQDDPWHDMETEMDVATRAMVNAREQYKQALDRVGAGDGSKGGKDWSHVSATAAQQVDAMLSALAQHINGIEPDYEAMNESVNAALEHPEKYAVPTAELQRRQDVMQNIKRKLDKAKSEVTHGMKLREKRIAMQQEAANRAAGGGKQGSPRGGGDNDVNGFMKQEYEAQQDLTRDQDKALDRIHAGVEQATHKAGLINTELVDQEKDLENIDKDMSKVQQKLEGAMTRINVLLQKTSDKGKIGIIICLMITLTVLVIFLFSGDQSTTSST